MKNEYEIRGDVTVIFLKRKNGLVLETLIKTSDLEKVKSFPGRWFAMLHGSKNRFYVKGHTPMIKGKQEVHLLHRWLLDNPKGLVIDHINHNTLDNTRENLRIVTQGQNNQNKKGAAKNSKSGVRGVHWNKQANKWHAQVGLNNKIIYLGLFDDLKEAEQAVIKARKTHMPFSQKDKAM